MKSPATKRACDEYKRLVALQSTLSEDQQWTIGSLIREAKAKVYVEMELDTMGLRHA